MPRIAWAVVPPAISLLIFVLLGPVLSGFNGAALSAGVSYPMEHAIPVLTGIAGGVWAIKLGHEKALLFPASLLIMFTLGACTDLNALQIAFVRVVIFASILLLAGAAGIAYSKRFFISLCVGAVPAFVAGARAMEQVPELSGTGYFLVGAVAGMLLLLAAGGSMGLMAIGYMQNTGKRFRRIPAVSSFLSLF